MPSTLKIRVRSARSLPVMDKSAKTTDAYVEVRLGGHVYAKTGVAKKTLNPEWNIDMRINCTDDSVVQNEPLEFRVMDSDTYSADDPIGYVHIDLNPLLTRAAKANTQNGDLVETRRDMVIEGWFPIYDTLMGARGELQISVKVLFLGDANPFKDSSAGVQFFSTSLLASPTVDVAEVFGFVEELFVHDDPEYEFENKFRSPQKSNDSRFRLLYRLSCGLRRQLGKKVQDLGGNAVLGYSQTFDVEGDSGIVARACGTACRLETLNARSLSGSSRPTTNALESRDRVESSPDLFFNRSTGAHGSGSKAALSPKLSPRSAGGRIYHRSMGGLELSPAYNVDGSDGNGGLVHAEGRYGRDSLSINVNSPSSDFGIGQTFNYAIVLKYLLAKFPVDVDATGNGQLRNGIFETMMERIKEEILRVHRPLAHNLFKVQKLAVAEGDNVRELSREVQLLTLNNFGSSVRLRLAGVVSAQSVKYLGKLHAKISDRETRDAWWAELRDEIRSHARVLKCWFIVGYSETCTIMDDVCILSATGTAAVVRRSKRRKRMLRVGHTRLRSNPTSSPTRTGWSSLRANSIQRHVSVPLPGSSRASRSTSTNGPRIDQGCAICHIPYLHDSAPYANMRLVPCQSCKRKWVPEVMLATIEPPTTLPVCGRGTLVQARACKVISMVMGQAQKGEALALAVSEILPFLQYDLHRQLINKMKIMGANAAFGLRTQIQLGPNLLVGIVTATAVCLPALPAPRVLHIQRNIKVVDAEDRALVSLQEQLQELSEFNKECMAKLPVSTVLPRKLLVEAVTACKSSPNSPRTSAPNSPRIGPTTQNRLPRSRSMSETTVTRPHSLSPKSQLTKEIVGSDSSSSPRSSSRLSKSSTMVHLKNDPGENVFGPGTTKINKELFPSVSSPPPAPSIPSVISPNTAPLPVQVDNGDSKLTGRMTPPKALEIGPPALRVQTDLPKSRDDALSSSSTGSSSSSTSTDGESGSASNDSSFSGSDEVLSGGETRNRTRRRRRTVEETREPFVLEVDDETDEDIMSVLMDQRLPFGISMVNTGVVPGCAASTRGSHSETLVVTRRVPLGTLLQSVKSARKNIELASVFKSLFTSLIFKIRRSAPCMVCSLNTWIGLPLDGSMEIVITGAVVREAPLIQAQLKEMKQNYVELKMSPAPCMLPLPIASNVEMIVNQNIAKMGRGGTRSQDGEQINRETRQVFITTASFVPRRKVLAYVGHINLHFIRESWVVTDLGHFYHEFLAQIQECMRAQVAANGGNALLSFNVMPHESGGKLYRNQIYTMLSVSGDAVLLE